MSKKPSSQGKGDKRRPKNIDRQTFSDNWDSIFGMKDSDIERLEQLDQKIDKNLDNPPEQG